MGSATVAIRRESPREAGSTDTSSSARNSPAQAASRSTVSRKPRTAPGRSSDHGRVAALTV